MTRTLSAWIAAAGIALIPIVGCRQILGIEERELTGGTGGGGGNAELCNEYCGAVFEGCLDPDDVYLNNDSCLNTCALLPAGSANSVAGNNIHCRLDKARKAKETGDVVKFCPASGPAGSGLCGTDCETYCGIINEVCPGSFPGIFASESDCLEDCESTIPSLPPFRAPTPDEDSIQCRLYHMTLALESEEVRAQHCPHAQGLSRCVP
jgi:hypothetical protein